MPDDPQPPLALTMGEPGGVGPEITVAAWRALRDRGPIFFVVGDPALYVRFGAEPFIIEDPAEAEAAFAENLPVLTMPTRVNASAGRAFPASAGAVIESIEHAVRLALSGGAAGVVTNPIQKSSLIESGFEFPGHTEFLAALTQDAPMPNGRRRGAVMMLAGPELKTVPVTIHQSVRKAIESLSPALVEGTARIIEESLRCDFGLARPRLAVSGLNPHAGENGALGREDDEIIAPAIAALQSDGFEIAGPLPADTMFHAEARASYDAALCMLHDQALIPAKTLAFHDAVNVTLGLPIVRTSPDHGTALDIAGTGKARADSLIAAIRLAAELAGRRAAS